ncbi:alcohol dehydrogenase catalytic domain-containing protein [Nostoc sp.]|uniref:alcohol dehydrogenase catalytic domain-containing protein n=1 Tax=Nostoc sp. TaxID=1180 RepID=UPI002FF7A022
MQAIRVHDYGALDVLTLETIAPPEPQPNEVLIRVQAAGINPIDWKIRSGSMKATFSKRCGDVFALDGYWLNLALNFGLLNARLKSFTDSQTE